MIEQKLGQIVYEENNQFTWIEIYEESKPNSFILMENIVLSQFKPGDFIELSIDTIPGREFTTVKLIEENMYHLFPYSQFRSNQK